jgi:hypothetical protein
VGVGVAVGGSGAVGDRVLGDAGAQPTAISRHRSRTRTTIVRIHGRWVTLLLRFNL